MRPIHLECHVIKDADKETIMVETTQLLTPANILIILLLVITLGIWLQLVLLRNRLSSSDPP